MNKEESLRKEISKILYEPEHEKGIVCWCNPKSIVRNQISLRGKHMGSVNHIKHNEQREVISQFIIEKVYQELSEIRKAVEQMKFSKEEIKMEEIYRIKPEEVRTPEYLIEQRVGQNIAFDKVLALLDTNNKEGISVREANNIIEDRIKSGEFFKPNTNNK